MEEHIIACWLSKTLLGYQEMFKKKKKWNHTVYVITGL